MITKRRTVWLNDDDWLALEAMAGKRRVNVSQLLRAVAAVPDAPIFPALEVARSTLPVHVAPLPAPRPFTPAPKPGRHG